MIAYSTTPANIQRSVNTPAFEGWLPSNPIFLAYYFQNSPIDVTPFSVTFKVLDVIGNPAYSQYTEFKLTADQYYEVGNPLPWLTDACISAPGYPTDFSEIPVTNNNQEFTFTADYQNLPLLPVGSYSFYHVFRIYGKRGEAWHRLSVYTHILQLDVMNPKCWVWPTQLNYQHIVNTPSESLDVQVWGLSWEIVGRANMELSSATSGTTLTTYTDTYAGVTGPAQKISGSGLATITITLGEIYDTLPLSPTAQVGTIKAQSIDLTEVRNINYNVSVLSGPMLHVYKTQLEFFGVKTVQEPEAQEVQFVCTNPSFTFTSDPWILVTGETRLIDGFYMKVLIIKPLPTANMSVGTYSGTVQIQAVISGSTVTRTIQVNYTLTDFLTIPQAVNGVYFTLDPTYLMLSSSNVNTYMQMRLNIKTYDFATAQSHDYELNEKFILNGGIEKIHYGKRIHQLMRRLVNENQNTFYLPAKVKFSCIEKNISDDSIVRQAISPELNFYAGHSFGYLYNGFIDINTKMSRVTKSSFAFLNFPVIGKSYTLDFKRNNQPYSQFVCTYNHNACETKRIIFEDFDIGDVITVSLLDTNGQLINGRPNSKAFMIFPDGEHSNHIIWENEGLTQSAIECTGEYKVLGEISNVSQKLFDQIKEAIEILEVNKSVKLTINTGWLLKTDIDSIESLSMSRRAWLITESGNIELRYSGKQILSEDSQRELIEFTLEFDINKSYNEETYSARLGY